MPVILNGAGGCDKQVPVEMKDLSAVKVDSPTLKGGHSVLSHVDLSTSLPHTACVRAPLKMTV